MYQALYRKWRPQTFDDVVGQEHITLTLQKQVASDRLSHAYLFVGTRGTGKTTCAKILARAVNCEHPVNGNPCNQCSSCRGILDGSILDVVELDAASNNKVDDVRALQDEAIFSPASVKKRVYIIDEVHMLSTAAFNALLKILEEPPAHLLFILCTTELHKVLPTIVSRCQRHSFKRIEPGAIADRLAYVAAREGIDLAPDAAALLAGLADGGMRDALSLLDQCSAGEHITIDAVHSALGLAGGRRIEELLDAICAQETAQALKLFDHMWRGGKDPAGILDELGSLVRDVLIMKVAPRGGEALLSGVYDKNAVMRFAAECSASDLMDASAAIRGADLGGANPRRAAELCLVRLCVPEAGDSLTALKNRVSRLEAQLKSGLIAAPVKEAKSMQEPESSPTEDELPWYTDEDAPPPDTVADPGPSPAPSFEPEVPEKYAFEPKAEPDPKAETASDSESGTEELWDSLVKRLGGKLQVAAYSLLCSPVQVFGTMQGDLMTIELKNPLAKLLLDTPANVNIIRQELSDMLGRSAQVVFTRGEPKPAEQPDKSKLDALSRFPNVTFQ